MKSLHYTHLHLLSLSLLISTGSAQAQKEAIANQIRKDSSISSFQNIDTRSLSSRVTVNNGSILLGINDAGNLLIPTSTPGVDLDGDFVGMRVDSNGNWQEVIGKDECSSCEGFGISNLHLNSGKTYAGWATSSEAWLMENLLPSNIIENGVNATTEAELNDGHMSVMHEFSPFSESIYGVDITIENRHFADDIGELRYRRVLMWNIPKENEKECSLLLVGGDEKPRDLEYADGFFDGYGDFDPLYEVSASCTQNNGCPVHDFMDEGPVKTDERFQFLFRGAGDDGDEPLVLSSRETFTFKMFYGVATGIDDMRKFISDSGAEIASVSYLTNENGSCGSLEDATSSLYIVAFRGVGGTPLSDASIPDGSTEVTAPPKSLKKSKSSKSSKSGKSKNTKSLRAKSWKSDSEKEWEYLE
ncbi:hypothetical protein CTEN210_09385 [Chaetoceros tenuissimus]|uniref:Uncharacterized protein n=1 Tax=Chaetoceros tenuissimus TaxID=426638 RepID=A0AAD3H7L2_9STRA|nr:hypothetical protein CTEN210_09385 [Chaetoceros tenuissimus]